ncbi:MAG: hypothetical protein SF052_23280 [Bacteroidia bacterium]|nr:hypothetical protein [Bacteroidia bacterium]
MKLLKPFSILRSDDDDSYFQHRQWMRFVNVLGVGIHRIAEEQTNRLIEANREIGNQLDTTLKKGFTTLEAGQKKIHHAILDQTEVIRDGLEVIEVKLGKGFDQVAGGLNEVANRVDQVSMSVITSGEKLAKGIMGLRAALDMGMVSIVSQFELQRSEIQVGFDRMTHILENNRKTEAHERYRDGKLEYERYLQHPDEPQFLTDAHEYLQESVRIYRGNPFCHLYLGHIFQEPAQYYDLRKSLEHYQLCATYAKGIPNPPLAALGYFLSAWINYVLGNVDAAIEDGEKVREFDPDGIPENYFNLAKFYARKKDASKALQRLDFAIQKFDPTYSLKADIDDDFQDIRPELDVYFENIRTAAAQTWEGKMKEMGIMKLLP